MATRSRIAIERADGRVESIYCHWDGHPDTNGATLLENYRDRAKVEKLIALGEISSLGKEVEPKGEHSFKNPEEGVTVAYHRDRGDALRKPRVDGSRNLFIRSDVEEYGYLFTLQGEWLFIDGSLSTYDREAIQLARVAEY